MPAPEADGVALPTPMVELNCAVLLVVIVVAEIVLLLNVCVVSVPTSVVLASGKSSVRLLLELGAAIVNVPLPLAFG